MRLSIDRNLAKTKRFEFKKFLHDQNQNQKHNSLSLKQSFRPNSEMNLHRRGNNISNLQNLKEIKRVMNQSMMDGEVIAVPPSDSKTRRVPEYSHYLYNSGQEANINLFEKSYRYSELGPTEDYIPKINKQ